MTSLEHAISLVDEEEDQDQDQDQDHPLLAAYHFGTPQTGKYLAQFIRAHASFINHVPARLLLGPAAPAHHPLDVQQRYNTTHFTRPSPAYIAVSSPDSALASVVAGAGTGSRVAVAEKLAHATREIGERKREDWIAIGFFEQGILIGLGVLGLPILAGMGSLLFYGARAGLRWCGA